MSTEKEYPVPDPNHCGGYYCSEEHEHIDCKPKVKVVAFLQNFWAHDPERVHRLLSRDSAGKLREILISASLFSGCLTGRRIRSAFGDLRESIIWEEASPVIADNPRDYHPPDGNHIRSVLDKHSPGAVLCLTKRGMAEIYAVVREWRGLNFPFISAPHPAARGANVLPDLQEAARRIRSLQSTLNPNPQTP